MAAKKQPKRPPTSGSFKKGQSGNPGGRPHLPEDLRNAASLSKKEALQKLVTFLHLPLEQLETIVEDKSLKVMDHWIAMVCKLGIQNGDAQRLNFMLDRIIGKVTDKIEHSTAKPTLIAFSNGEQLLLGNSEE